MNLVLNFFSRKLEKMDAADTIISFIKNLGVNLYPWQEDFIVSYIKRKEKQKVSNTSNVDSIKRGGSE